MVIPCLNEERTVAKVIEDMKVALPGAEITVFDNGSTDRTAEIACASGATVIASPRRGKGNVIRHMANVIDADVYVLLDGDDTYPAAEAPRLLQRFLETGVDMLVATRLESHDAGAFRVFHELGNRLIARIIALLYRAPITDVLSGYRLLSSRFVRLVHLRSEGFEIETEMTLQALAKGLPILEVPIEYGRRPDGSHSKLDTVSDGLLIFKCIFLLFKDYKPFVFFTAVAAIFALFSVITGAAPVLDFYQHAYVYHVPRAILAAGLAILAAVSFGVGLLLDTISGYHQETIEQWKRSMRG
ncbi:MAG: glycosyltransferase family 2 protein [Proteobacteria bacterium]|nr:glycosyltransferase family 2 protein [Pseudomonadota bacterium]